MKTYNELKAGHREEVNNFEGIFWAFTEGSFREGLHKLGCEESELRNLPGGGFIKADRVSAFKEMFQRHGEERETFLKDIDGLTDALAYEFSNHECDYTGDYQPGLDALGLTESDIPAEVWKKAVSLSRCS